MTSSIHVIEVPMDGKLDAGSGIFGLFAKVGVDADGRFGASFLVGA